MAILTVRAPLIGGVTFAMENAAGGGDSFPNSGSEILVVRNGDASGKTVTIDSPGTCNFGAAANAAHDVTAFNIPAGQIGIFGPFPMDRFNDANGRVQISYSAVTSVQVTVIAPKG